MAINGKTLSTVEGLVTANSTSEGDFRTGIGDALFQIDENEVSINTINALTPFPAFDNSTWSTASFSGQPPASRSFTAPSGGNGIFLIGQITVRSYNTSVNGSFGSSISGDGSYCVISGSYAGYLIPGGGTGFGGNIAGNPIAHTIQGFLAPGGTLTISASNNMYIATNVIYKVV